MKIFKPSAVTEGYIFAIYALWQRDVRKFFRQRSRLLSGLAQPLMYLLALGLGMNSIFHAAGYGNYTSFLTPGIITMTLMTSSFISGVSVLWDRKFGFLKEALVAPIPRFCIVIGRALGAATVALIQGILILTLALILGVKISASIAIPATLIMVLIGLIFGSMGVFFGAIIEDFQSIQMIVSFVLMPLFFLSGALFPVASSNNKILTLIVHLNPLSYCVDAVRAIFSGQSYFGFLTDVTIIIMIISINLSLGALFFKKIKAA